MAILNIPKVEMQEAKEETCHGREAEIPETGSGREVGTQNELLRAYAQRLEFQISQAFKKRRQMRSRFKKLRAKLADKAPVATADPDFEARLRAVDREGEPNGAAQARARELERLFESGNKT